MEGAEGNVFVLRKTYQNEQAARRAAAAKWQHHDGCSVTQAGGPRCVETDILPVKTMLYPDRVSLVGMDAQSPDFEVFVNPPHTTAQRPSRTREYHELIHIACIVNPLRMVKIAAPVVTPDSSGEY